jgi:arylsulfatase A-like enzyme
MIKYFSHIKAYAPGRSGFFFGMGLFFISLAFNTSFHIMGVDIGEFISSMINEFFLLILISYGKILFSMLVFYFALGFIIHLIARELGWNRWIEFVILISLTFILWIHSVAMYPQIYGEFFYIRYPFLVFLLHFITDWIPPIVPQMIQWLFLALIVGRSIVLFLRDRDKNQTFLLWIIFLFLGLHLNGNIFFLLIFALLLPWMHIYWKKISEPLGFILCIFIIIIFQIPFILDLVHLTLNKRTNQEKKEKPNIFILAADSLRVDRLGFVSGNKEISPNIDKFAEDSTIFQDHHVTIPRTFPSWADFLTGEYSMAHGIRDMFPSPSEKNNIGNNRFPTLPQILKKHGYFSSVIGSFAADIFPRANWNFDLVDCPDFNARVLTVQRGLDSQLFFLPILTGSFFSGGNYISEVNGLSTLGDGFRILPNFKKIIKRNANNPLFMVSFSSVVHFPYTPPYPYYKKFSDPNYYGKYKYLKFVDPSQDDKPNNLDIQQIRSIFDSAVHAYDAEFGAMIQFLKDNDLYDDSIIILTADHGEALYEDIHGQGHGEHLRGENVTKVPLLIKMPLKKEKRDYIKKNLYSGITSSIDIFPTLLSFLSIPFPSPKPGLSLLPILEGDLSIQERSIYTETGIWFSDRGNHFFQKQRIPYPNILQLHKVVPEEEYQIMITDYQFRETIAFSKHRALLKGNYKLIYIPTRESVIYELYDRKKDPSNQVNLWQSGSIGASMRKELQDLILHESKAKLVGEYILPTSLP